MKRKCGRCGKRKTVGGMAVFAKRYLCRKCARRLLWEEK